MIVMKIALLFVSLAVGGIVVESKGERLERASGGMPISIETAPHFVSLRRYAVQVCGGSFISTEHVLTAAHCVVDELFRKLYHTRVISGTDKFNRRDDGHGIKDIFPHEGYLTGHSDCDIAVITLSIPVEWSGNRNQTKLPNAGPRGYHFARLAAFKLYNTQKSNASLVELIVSIHSAGPNSISIDDSDQVFYGNLRSRDSISNSDLGGALVSEGRIVGVAFKTPQSNKHGCYFINVVKFKTFIEGCLNSGRPSVISWAPKRPRL